MGHNKGCTRHRKPIQFRATVTWFSGSARSAQSRDQIHSAGLVPTARKSPLQFIVRLEIREYITVLGCYNNNEAGAVGGFTERVTRSQQKAAAKCERKRERWDGKEEVRKTKGVALKRGSEKTSEFLRTNNSETFLFVAVTLVSPPHPLLLLLPHENADER